MTRVRVPIGALKNKMNKENFKQSFIKFHDKSYKLLLIIPAILLLFGFIYMSSFYSQHHDFIYKDISLSGGTSVTIGDGSISITDLSKALSGKLEDTNIRGISDLATQKQIAVIVETRSDKETTKKVLEDYLKYSLDEKNSSFEFTGSSLGDSFYNQLLIAMIAAFVLMAIVIFIQFKTFVPSLAVILSAFADIFFTIVLINLVGMRISSAGIVALLMLIGYSVDTDILLTNKVLRREGKTLNRKILESFKTGITMTLIAIASTTVCLIIAGPYSQVLYQIFFIMLFGLIFDILNTWLTNVSIIKWYSICLQKKKNEN
jgi:preprotein translocase subunit SecF